jgi:RNA polymerase sigma-70 factor (TIGR02943 family)
MALGPRLDTGREENTMSEGFPAENCSTRPDLPDPAEWRGHYGDALDRYALARLRRPDDAEAAVQEALLAALRARGQFQGRSQPLTWLMAILKRKVVDRLRTAAREARGTDLNDLDAWFDARGKWRKSPRRWDDPAAAAERSEFWPVVRRCLARLPARMGAAFALRVLDEQAPAEVCHELGISPDNLWVLMHRARLQLVRCLELHWFDAKGKPC